MLYCQIKYLENINMIRSCSCYPIHITCQMTPIKNLNIKMITKCFVFFNVFELVLSNVVGLITLSYLAIDVVYVFDSCKANFVIISSNRTLSHALTISWSRSN